jgi:2-polyprenyl-6-methoxyphenol hydroxylase-like FAD-dependent oxidoreductase
VKALIVGAGIAGPLTGMALRRADIDAEVFEAYDRTVDDAGSYLTIATNGLDALRALEVDGVVRAAGFPTERNVLLNHRGRQLGVVSNGGRRPDGTVAHTVKRPRLHRVLREAAIERGVDVRYGRRLVDVRTMRTEGTGGVVARFADGTEASGDVLIGADGVDSMVRRCIDPSAPAPRYMGLLNFGGYTADHRPEGADADTWYMIFGREAFVGYVLDDRGGTVWFVNVPSPPIPREEAGRLTAEDWRRRLLDLVARDAGPAQELIADGDLELVADHTFDLPSVPRWHRDRMVVVGDAAHAPTPSSGQGASMAAEDAVVLALCLRDAPDVPAALTAFEERRRARVERIVADGARTSSSKTPGPAGRVARDLALPLVFKLLVTDRSRSWLHDHHLAWTSPAGARQRP